MQHNEGAFSGNEPVEEFHMHAFRQDAHMSKVATNRAEHGNTAGTESKRDVFSEHFSRRGAAQKVRALGIAAGLERHADRTAEMCAKPHEVKFRSSESQNAREREQAREGERHRDQALPQLCEASLAD